MMAHLSPCFTARWNNPSNLLMFLIPLVLCFGCESSPANSQQSQRKSGSPAELAKFALEEVEEFKFCVTERAGEDTLQRSATRLSQIVESLSASSTDDKSAESLKASCQRLADAVTNQTSEKKLIQICDEIRKNLKPLSN